MNIYLFIGKNEMKRKTDSYSVCILDLHINLCTVFLVLWPHTRTTKSELVDKMYAIELGHLLLCSIAHRIHKTEKITLNGIKWLTFQLLKQNRFLSSYQRLIHFSCWNVDMIDTARNRKGDAAQKAWASSVLSTSTYAFNASFSSHHFEHQLISKLLLNEYSSNVLIATNKTTNVQSRSDADFLFILSIVNFSYFWCDANFKKNAIKCYFAERLITNN